MRRQPPVWLGFEQSPAFQIKAQGYLPKTMSDYLLKISTTQFAVSDEPVVEEASASFRIVNGTRYISYVMPANEDTPAVSTIIRVDEESLEIRRSGGIRGKILYFPGGAASSQLDLGFLSLNITNETEYLKIIEMNDNLAVTVKYKLYINDEFISDCKTEILLTSAI
ncbi:MAG: DUF1934 domain-containing protein [Lachnospiraceae bacterium]|nr:DUF1934 domain-containing protein [Lachnospiraceae bacterium]